MQTAWSYFVMVSAAMDVLTTPLCHGPTFAAFAIQGHIQSAEILRVRHTPLKASSQRVIRRKNAAYKSDDGQTMFAVIA
jgi:hypothetical protein